MHSILARGWSEVDNVPLVINILKYCQCTNLVLETISKLLLRYLPCFHWLPPLSVINVAPCLAAARTRVGVPWKL